MKILDVGTLNTINQPTDTAQLPIKAGTLLFLQQAYQEGFAALIQGLLGSSYISGQPYYLYGCANTGTYPTYNISAGAIFYNPYPNWAGGSYSIGNFVTYQGCIYISMINGNTDTPPGTNWQLYSTVAGEIFLVPPTQFTLSSGQFPICVIGNTSYTGLTVPVTLKADPVTFTDGSTHYVHTGRVINVLGGALGSGSFDYPLWGSIPYVLDVYDSVKAETSRATIQENVIAASLVPIGGITMYYNTTNNWSATYFDSTGKGVTAYGTQNFALCNGNNGTPDLRGMFIAGFDDRASGGDPDYTTIGNSGGNKSSTLAADNIPAHRHTFAFMHYDWNNIYSDGSGGGWFTGAYQGATGGNVAQNFPPNNTPDLRQDTGYALTYSTGGSTKDYWMGGGNTGDGTNNINGQDQISANSFGTRPPYYTLAYIMRIS